MRILQASLISALLPFAAAAEEKEDKPVEFNRDIRPIFQDTCFQCHGADAHKAKGDLQLDTLEHAMKPNEDGLRGLVPGSPEKSHAWQRIISDDPDELMPPAESHKVLTAAQKDLIRRWIAQGAKYQAHWSYLPPQAAPAPKVADPLWNRNAVDAHIAARLAAAGLKPNPEADRASLIRRVALDLTGLLPEPAEVEAFVNDKDPQAYEKLVDRLLASPRYGENSARLWLDLARYGDTHGIHIDNYRSIWPYRDWVIKAFNANLPYDQFSIEQLAGDLLPNPSQDQLAATGYLRCNPTTNEGGAIAEEYLAIYAKDRVEAFSAAWLGLTTGCAACHDHKFDPIAQKDFYRLAAYFRNLDTPAMDGNIATTAPTLVIPSPADAARANYLAADIEQVKKELELRGKNVSADFETWAAGFSLQNAPQDTMLLLRPAADGSFKGMIEGKTFSLPSRTPAAAKGRDFTQDPPKIAEISGVIGDVGDFDAADSFSYGGWLRTNGANGALLARMNSQAGYRGWDLWLEGGHIAAHFIDTWNGNALKVVSKEVLDPKEWNHVFVTYDGSRSAAGVGLYVNGNRVGNVEIQVETLTGSLKTDVPLTLGYRSKGGGEGAGGAQLRDLRVYSRLLSSTEVAALGMSARDLEILKTPADKRDPKDHSRLLALYASSYDPESARLRQRLDSLEAESKAIAKRNQVTLIAREKKSRAHAHVLNRGQYDQKGEEVFPGVPPAAGVALPAGAPENRLTLARWLFHPQHPLTARVTANRLWQQVFGQGLVITAEDLGTTGELPSHPELLDHLALRLRDSNWDVKALLRYLVLSQTYRQSARISPEKLEKDPRNRLLSRGPRNRLDAEVIRDTALQSSGLLVEKIGGPSVKPYQPAGVWEAVAMKESDTRFFKQDKGENLYRRSLYTFIKRTAPPPNMETFNATSRESPCARRERTNTPLQALVTLNDPQFVEAARALAQRVLASAGDDAARLALAHRLVTCRSPDEARLKILSGALAKFRSHYASRPKEAAALLAVGESPRPAELKEDELAAWTLLASQLLNLDETLNR
ncbi:MAG: hypothetical protein RL095_2503 [Verrucomicrobiota bacterium]|jgi:cytochrome c553